MKDHHLVYTRILHIDHTIRSGSFPNKRILAESYEGVSERTIARDIEFMRDRLNAPIEYDAVKRGYYYSKEYHYIPSIPIKEEELFALTIMQKTLEQYKNAPIYEKLVAIFDKIRAFLPDNTTIDSGWLEVETSFILDPLPMIPEHVFNMIFEALHFRKRITFSYRGLETNFHSIRIVDPYHVICKRGAWYLLAFCRKKNAIRLFSFARMQDIKILLETFSIPVEFKPTDYFDQDMGVWITRDAPVQVKLLFDGKSATYVMERTWHPTQELQVLEDGSISLIFSTNQLEEVFRWVLSQGSRVTVLEPTVLAERIISESQKISALYSK